MRSIRHHRFIPTCVGFMAITIPRAAKNRGSSPRAWGLSDFPAGVPGSRPVHPHVRGVYAAGSGKILRLYGSSPRAWGLCEGVFLRVGKVRFIPTCVGFILLLFPDGVKRSVHPHVRGVYSQNFWNRSGFHGSSPRAWGLCLPQ